MVVSPPPLTEIHRLRKKLKLSQSQLAKLAGTSQSLIARIEAGTVDPGYSHVCSIFSALTDAQGKGIIASEIMNPQVIGIQQNDTIGDAISTLEGKGISQVPVFDRHKIVGSFSEKTVQSYISEGVDPKKISNSLVREVMDAPFPTVSPHTQLSALSTLLDYNKAITVVEAGKTVGIITNADMLKVLHR